MFTKDYKQSRIKPFYMLNDIFSVNDIERKYSGYWFSKDSMRFFKSKVIQDVFPVKGKLFFVSSEQNGSDKRKFTVRCFDIKANDIKTIGEFQGYETKTKALTAALNCAYDSLESKER